MNNNVITIQQNEQYNLPINVHVGDTVITPEIADNVIVQFGDYTKDYISETLLWDEDAQMYLFPITSDMTSNLVRTETWMMQVGIEIGEDYILGDVQRVTIRKSIIGSSSPSPQVQDYNVLTNKPQINGVELIGDKTLADLGIDLKYGKLPDKPQINGVTLIGNKSLDDLGITKVNDYTDLDKKPAINSVTLVGNKSLADLGISDNYNDFRNKPSINNIPLTGNKYANELGLLAPNDLKVVYKDGGRKPVSELTNTLLTSNNHGYVYYCSTSGTTTSDYVDGAGKPINTNDTVVVVLINGEYKFKLFSGIIDVSVFQTKELTNPIMIAGKRQTTVEGALTALANSGGGGGGGGGTTDYDALYNKPSINDVELTGNKTLDELGIASKADLTSVLHFAGSLYCEDLLPELLTIEHFGDVYDIRNDGVTNEYFLEGAGKEIERGDNVAIAYTLIDDEIEFRFDLLSGNFDASALQTKELVNAVIVGGATRTTVETALSALATETDKKITQYATLPTASAEYLGKTVQYIGVSSGIYIHNYFYEVVEDDGTYSWQPTAVQDGISSSELPDALTNAQVDLIKSKFNPVQTANVIINTQPLEEYSTTEQVVGTWIDGKPIYRKVFYNDGNALQNNIDVTSLHIDRLINDWAEGHTGAAQYTYTGSHIGSGRFIDISNNILTYHMLNISAEITYWIALEYTKTTD